MLLILIKAIYIIINVIIGIYDFSFYRIPNILLGALLVLYGLYAPIYMDVNEIFSSVLIFGLALTITFGLYAFRFIGAGDAKYISVVSLWAGAPRVIPLLIFITLLGGVLAFGYLLLKDYLLRFSDWVWLKIQKGEECCPFLCYMWEGSESGPEYGKRENIDNRMIPYGVAIAGGAILMMLLYKI